MIEICDTFDCFFSYQNSRVFHVRLEYLREQVCPSALHDLLGVVHVPEADGGERAAAGEAHRFESLKSYFLRYFLIMLCDDNES